MDAFARHLLGWHELHGRHDLPWQHPRTPYRVWISEVMLQQTRVTTVIPYFERFVATLPTLAALAAAPTDQVMALWSGLGYYRRAHHLQSAARVCIERHHGQLPRDPEALAALPGIGCSTAGAILALAHDLCQPILDGNARRVLARFHGVRGWPGDGNVASTLWMHAREHTPTTRAATYTQAIMDLGATVCTRTRPTCGECPLAGACLARRDALTSEIPAPRPTRALPSRRTTWVVLRDRRQRVMLQRRPATGVWPGLWSLPEATGARAARTLAATLAETAGIVARKLPQVTHTFTHFRLLASPLEWRDIDARAGIQDVPDTRWCSRADLTRMGIPAPVHKLLG